MTGTITNVRRNGVQATVSPAGTPTGVFSIIRASDGSIAGSVSLWRQLSPTDCLFNWTNMPPDPLPDVGDTLVPYIG